MIEKKMAMKLVLVVLEKGYVFKGCDIIFIGIGNFFY